MATRRTLQRQLLSPSYSPSHTPRCFQNISKVILESTFGEPLQMYEFQVLSSGTNVALQGSVSHFLIIIVIWTDIKWIFGCLMLLSILAKKTNSYYLSLIHIRPPNPLL